MFAQADFFARSALSALLLAGLSNAGCKNGIGKSADAGPNTSDAMTATDGSSAGDSGAKSGGAVAPLGYRRVLPKGPSLAAIALDVAIYERPSKLAKKLGALRLGAVVAREEATAGNEGCPAGFYKIAPRGYVCSGPEEASIDPNHPLALAAAVRPDLSKPLPYAYGFVRAVAPLYLRIPTRDEQVRREFGLKNHLKVFAQHGAEWQKATLGANDVELPGHAPITKKSTELTLGQLFGAQEDFDPIPFWLEGTRKIPNVSGFKVPANAVFAKRVHRHTGLAFIGAFKASPEAFDRPFAITTDLRLVPTTKVKPDSGSPWHGVELDDKLTVPFAFVRKRCDKKEPDNCPHAYRIEGDEVHKMQALTSRSTLKLTGKVKYIGKLRYREIDGGLWVNGGEMGAVLTPSEWPRAAGAGEKWVDVSIDNQTLTLWEGKKPVYATLVSTGQDGTGDPKTTKSTVQGTFRIRNKLVTATMDSNERTDGDELEAGASDSSAATANASSGKDSPGKDSPGKDSPGKDSPAKASGSKDENAKEPPAKKAPREPSDRKKPDDNKALGDDEQAGQTRRGQGGFELRDVPYVQYFDGAFALHVAYWHDVFGLARSHGCINLAPIDGQRIFGWTEPQVPENWHGLYVTEPGQGTVVVVHP
jgi:lipoprotein-anchoring transpeptidase ErfK/SrfK